VNWQDAWGLIRIEPLQSGDGSRSLGHTEMGYNGTISLVRNHFLILNVSLNRRRLL